VLLIGDFSEILPMPDTIPSLWAFSKEKYSELLPQKARPYLGEAGFVRVVFF